MDLSVVVPVYNEAGNIANLHNRLTAAIESVTTSYEIIYVDDGSKDDTLELLKAVGMKNPHIRYISFSRNFGHQQAISAGLDNASGKAIVFIDGDLQDPPELIPEMYDRWQSGQAVVYARRKQRKGESWFKKTTAKGFYRIMARMTNFEIPVDVGDFRIIDRKVADALIAMPERHKFLRGQIAWLGFEADYVEFDRDERKTGKTGFTLRKMMRFAMDGITAFSNWPLRFATFAGILVSLVAFIVIIYALWAKYTDKDVVDGWTSSITSTMFIGGIQLICIGIIGEYVSRIYNDLRKRPLYVINDSNLKEDKPDS